MKPNGRRCKFSVAERIAIVHEYETSNLTLREMNAKYGINSPNVILNWRKSHVEQSLDLEKSKKSIIFAPSNDIKVAEEVPMEERTPEELNAEIKRLTKELEYAKLQVLALNTMIDIAEEQGIQIRKKSGAKQ